MGNLAHLLKLFQESLNHIWASASVYRNAQLSRMPSSVPSSNIQAKQTLHTEIKWNDYELYITPDGDRWGH